MQVPSVVTSFSLFMPVLPRDAQVPEKKHQRQERAVSALMKWFLRYCFPNLRMVPLRPKQPAKPFFQSNIPGGKKKKGSTHTK